ncbi:MAG: DUF1156 domain-containing protein [Chloracidobacterium sp.]|nr:DUF1156 domain-containing protein [Chloracidobacterium sp.]
MVDDPSEYVDTLKSDPKLRKRAEGQLKKRHKVWDEATAELRRAEASGISAPPPGPEPTLDEIIAELERDRLFKIIEELVLWENTSNEFVLEKARREIWQSWRRECANNADHPVVTELFDRTALPKFHDPFAGGGALPLEARRLGLESYASDLNPVAVLINKAMIEIPSKFSSMPPVNNDWQEKADGEKSMKSWQGNEGIAADIIHYGKWVQDETKKRLGHLYPKVEISEEMVKTRPDLARHLGQRLDVSAYLWARTVASPNPAFRDVRVPLVATFLLSTKSGKEAFLSPVIANRDYTFEVMTGEPQDRDRAKSGTKPGSGGFRCIMSDTPIPFDYVRSEGKAGRIGFRLIALVVDTDRGRTFLSPTPEIERCALQAEPSNIPPGVLPDKALGFRIQEYGMKQWSDLYTPRQLVSLITLSDIVQELRSKVATDAITAGLPDDSIGLEANGGGALAYGDAIATFLAMAVDKFADYNNSLCTWNPSNQNLGHLFTKHAIPMAWDFPETVPFDRGVMTIASIAEGVARSVQYLPTSSGAAAAFQHDAATRCEWINNSVISTDPPYYDNIGYSDLSEFFYVWIRRTLKPIFPSLLATLAVPRSEELVATPHRHGGKEKADAFFLSGMTDAMRQLSSQSHPAFPVTIYYAFKQSEINKGGAVASTGWEIFLAAVIEAGFAITGTWPMRTVGGGRMLAKNANTLAATIILVCRKRPRDAPTVTRRELVNALKLELPDALRHLQRCNIAPVDLAQAAIGPGMAVYSRYEKVLDADGKSLSVRDALELINETLDEVLAEQEGDFDPDTRWALTWFEEMGFEQGEFGRAEQLSKAKNTSIAEMADTRSSPILEAKAGKVRLFRPNELEPDWTPESDSRLTVWDMVHQLVRVLEKDGEAAAAHIVAKLGAKAETARELCYRLYTLCDRKKRASEAMSYNGLVQSWPEIMRLSREATDEARLGQTPGLFENEI